MQTQRFFCFLLCGLCLFKVNVSNGQFGVLATRVIGSIHGLNRSLSLAGLSSPYRLILETTATRQVVNTALVAHVSGISGLANAFFNASSEQAKFQEFQRILRAIELSGSPELNEYLDHFRKALEEVTHEVPRYDDMDEIEILLRQRLRAEVLYPQNLTQNVDPLQNVLSRAGQMAGSSQLNVNRRLYQNPEPYQRSFPFSNDTHLSSTSIHQEAYEFGIRVQALHNLIRTLDLVYPQSRPQEAIEVLIKTPAAQELINQAQRLGITGVDSFMVRLNGTRGEPQLQAFIDTLKAIAFSNIYDLRMQYNAFFHAVLRVTDELKKELNRDLMDVDQMERLLNRRLRAGIIERVSLRVFVSELRDVKNLATSLTDEQRSFLVGSLRRFGSYAFNNNDSDYLGLFMPYIESHILHLLSDQQIALVGTDNPACRYNWDVSFIFQVRNLLNMVQSFRLEDPNEIEAGRESVHQSFRRMAQTLRTIRQVGGLANQQDEYVPLQIQGYSCSYPFVDNSDEL